MVNVAEEGTAHLTFQYQSVVYVQFGRLEM